MNYTYRIFVNGAFFNGSDDYNFAYNRALGLALYHKCEFFNSKVVGILDRWTGEGDIKLIIITKSV